MSAAMAPCCILTSSSRKLAIVDLSENSRRNVKRRHK